MNKTHEIQIEINCGKMLEECSRRAKLYADAKDEDENTRKVLFDDYSRVLENLKIFRKVWLTHPPNKNDFKG